MLRRQVTVKSLLLCIAIVFLAFNGSPIAHAGEADLYLMGSYFTWKEYDTDLTTQILKESGPLYGIGYAYHGRIPSGDDAFYDGGGRGAALTLTPRVELFGGKIDYDGQACDLSGTCVAMTTDSGHGGGKVEFDVGIADDRAFQLELFAGVGVRGWLRTIKDSTDAVGSPVKGYAERWVSAYSRIGMRAEFDFHETSRFFFEVVAKSPISNDETAYLSDVNDYLDDVDLKPGEESSVFCSAGFKFGAFKIRAFYETLNFSESPHVIQYNTYLGTYLEFWQPKSEAKTYGLSMGASF